MTSDRMENARRLSLHARRLSIGHVDIDYVEENDTRYGIFLGEGAAVTIPWLSWQQGYSEYPTAVGIYDLDEGRWVK
jgi:hypothetical protein